MPVHSFAKIQSSSRPTGSIVLIAMKGRTETLTSFYLIYIVIILPHIYCHQYKKVWIMCWQDFHTFVYSDVLLVLLLHTRSSYLKGTAARHWGHHNKIYHALWRHIHRAQFCIQGRQSDRQSRVYHHTVQWITSQTNSVDCLCLNTTVLQGREIYLQKPRSPSLIFAWRQGSWNVWSLLFRHFWSDSCLPSVFCRLQVLRWVGLFPRSLNGQNW